jgi:hypothetical protein
MSRWLAVLALFSAGPVWAQEEPAGQEEEAPAVAVAVPSEDADGESTIRPLLVRIQLSNENELKGTLLQTTTLDMKTSFGPAEIPLNEVAGIRMAQEGNASTTVVLHNGDSITGAAEFDSLSLETEWGKAEVNAPHITSIMFNEGLHWVSEKGLNGERWKLSDQPETTQANATTSAAAARTAAPARTYRVVPTYQYGR